MITINYLGYYPKMIFRLPSGLTIYESVFENADGGRGVIGGPHKIFNHIMQKIIFTSPSFQTNIMCTEMVIN